MPRLVYIVTHPMTARFLMQGQLAWMRRKGFDVVVIASPDEDLPIIKEREGVATVGLPMQREIQVFQDLISLMRLYKMLRFLQPDIVNAGTPKAGLLGMLAARMARVPIRLYTLRGLRLETTRGLKRLILSMVEKLTSSCAYRIWCVSKSLADSYIDCRLAPRAKLTVIGAGSSNGVDAERFGCTQKRLEEARVLGTRLGIPVGVPIVGFVGRFTRDKGIVELLDAFDRVVSHHPRAYLLLVGDFEQGDAVPENYTRRLREHPQVVMAGFVKDTVPYYHLMDVLAFPSHREGFPNAPLEAAAAGIPVVGFGVTGTTDAVQDGVTGTLVPIGDVHAFAAALCRYLDDPRLRQEHGRAARERVLRDFRQEAVWEALYREYTGLLHQKGLSVPEPHSTAQARTSPL